MTKHDAPTQTTEDQLLREAFLDAGAKTLNEVRNEFRSAWQREQELIRAQNRQLTADLDALLAPIKERVARLEGEIAMLTTLLSDANGHPKAKRLRQRDNNHRRLLEPHRVL